MQTPSNAAMLLAFNTSLSERIADKTTKQVLCAWVLSY
jgi:hypothetical protein